jgi:5-methyltetrahydropteroyltriglutamate--homocysteine methyltransferase
VDPSPVSIHLSLLHSQTKNMSKVRSSNLGYPHIGENREWKKAIESYWKGSLPESDFLAQMDNIRLEQLKKQRDAGIDLIPVNDFTFYDHVLDTAVMFGVIPGRYQYPGGQVSLTTYYAMARGRQEVVAC